MNCNLFERSSSNTFRDIAEKLFLAFLLRILGENLSPPTVFGVERCKWARLKRHDVAQISQEGDF